LTRAAGIGLDWRVPKYDAFGREIGEDTLSGLGGDEKDAGSGSDWEARIAEARAAQEAEEQEQAVPQPAPEPAVFTAGPQVPIAPPPSPTGPAQRPMVSIPRTGRRNRSGFGCLVGFVILTAILVGPVIAIVSFVGDTADEIKRSIPNLSDPGSGDETAPPPQGLGARSMIRAQHLSPALRQIRAMEAGRLGDLTVWADRVDATLVTRRTREQSVVVTYSGEVRKGNVHDVGIPQETIAWGDVDPEVPEKLARAAAGKAGADDINYVIARPPTVFDSGKLTWIAYYKSGRIVQGDANGKPTRRIS
jgi:hypothetical protein